MTRTNLGLVLGMGVPTIEDVHLVCVLVAKGMIPWPRG